MDDEISGETAPRRRAPLAVDLSILAIIGVLLIAALGAGAAALYREFYSPSAFVLRYLSLLENGRAADALVMPGVDLDGGALAAAGLPATASPALLRETALGRLRDATIVSERQDGGDTVVTAHYIAGSYEGTTTFRIAPDGFIGVAPAWRFAQSPLAAIDVGVLGSMSFTVNGFTLDKRQVSPDGAGAVPGDPVSLLVFSPGLYSVFVDTAMSRSPGVAVLADSPAKTVPVDVQAQPTEEFVSVVQQRVEAFLTACTTQQILQPTGCPFGFVVRNRVETPPKWSIVSQPTITIVPDGAGWRIPDAAATAHIELEIRSLYDGSVQQVSEDVPFIVNGQIDVLGDGTASIRVGGTTPE